jgi:dihydroorotate dehydrogenase (NAD+) catalytic subunit
MSDVDLSTAVGDLQLPNPVMTAAGCAVAGRELDQLCDVTQLGAFVTRTVTLDPRSGWPTPRVAETPSGVLHATGLQNPGLQGFLATELPWLAQRRVRTVVSIAGQTLGEYAELARRVGGSPGVSAVEVNLASPNRDGRGRLFGGDPYQAGKVLAVVRRDVPRGVPVLAKLVPDCAVVDVASAAVANGADALVLVHGFAAMALDRTTWRPALGAGTAELSGPAVHALAVRRVWDVHAALPDVPLVGVGGIATGYDALEMLLAGAAAVQLGSVLFRDPAAPVRVLDELRAELTSRGVARLADVVGLGHHAHEPADEGEPR